jgi:hypothetical protein
MLVGGNYLLGGGREKIIIVTLHCGLSFGGDLPILFFFS